ncbi:NAD(P)/FAD-dependent oxidoreductase [Microbacterium sp. EST19A]|uniref:NAD(P)/FAD-dependent oxidoreductase n=1 Tax=Microbacterium sp. EST19A TaxID=2862681 RepID=UPI001CC0E60B|nr:FAD-dependent oxidoreductase [Microbacterium sp. EST19A]
MQNILIVGGGYAGFYAAWNLERRLRRAEAKITIVDPRPYMTYQPFLPEVVAGSVEARHVVVSLRSHLRRTTVVPGRVTSITHADKKVEVRMPDGSSQTLRYDIIVVTAGAVSRVFPIDGISEHAIGLKTVEEAVAVRDQILTAFEDAAALPPGLERRRLLTATVVGGGFSGVEVFGEMLALATSLLKSYPELRFSELSFHLIEANGRILPEVTDKPGRWVVEHLTQRGGIVHLNSRITSAAGGEVQLSTGERYASNILVWAAGNASNPVVASHTDLPIDARGLVITRPDLRIGTSDEIVEGAWAAGDDAAIPDLALPESGARTVPNAQHAVRQGRLLAKNITAVVRGELPRDYRHPSFGTVATLGLGHGIFQYKGIVVKGLLAWLMHRGYHVLAVPTWDRKARVLLLWIASFLFGRDIVSLESVQHPRAAFLEAIPPIVTLAVPTPAEVTRAS